MSLNHFFYEPFYSLSDFDRLFDEAFSARQGPPRTRDVARPQSTLAGLRPKMDVHEDKENNTVTASFELPGLQKEDVQIDIQNNVLSIAGETRADEQKEENGYAVRERRFGRFSRSIPVPQGLKKEEEVKASLENGVLTVTFPRTAPELAPKRINIA
ncbi:small heat shock protein [Vararia minispora EC-137]|uniref:Small heat shock protein n=1 Tax=Vararia minispora EC-137 TaxID=1314806 RepID=A0ACB8Q960_9AGAM|nr:small heat shock protein [Vararia minispora EC-137]